MAKSNKGKGKPITKKEFDLLQLLKESGVPQSKAAGVVSRSKSIANKVYKFDSWDDWQAAKKARREALRKPKIQIQKSAEPRIREFLDAPADTSKELKMIVSQLNGIIAVLKAIEFKL